MTLDWQKARGLLHILNNDMQRGQLLQHAYAMSYVTLLSLVPSLAVTFAVISLFTPFLGENSSLVRELKGFILSHLATGSGETVTNYLDRFIENVDLKKIGFSGFIGTLVALVLLLRNIEAAFNRIFEVDKERPLLGRFIYFWTLITLGTFIAALTIGTFSGFNLDPSGWLDMSENPLAGQLVYYLGFIIFFTLMFKLVPNRFVTLKSAFFGSIAATLLLTLAIRIFRWYTSIFTTYEAIYGAALSALPVFLIWMYVVWLIVLFSATLTWRLQKGFKTQQDELTSMFQLGEHHQEHRLRSELPELLLQHFYLRYQQAPFHGLSFEDLATRYAVPLHWLSEALETLTANGLVDRLLDPETGAERFIPTYLPGQLSEQDLKARLWQQYQDRLAKVSQELNVGENSSAAAAPIPTSSKS
jgi:membrane protein